MAKRSLFYSVILLIFVEFAFSAKIKTIDDGQNQQQIVVGQFVVKFKSANLNKSAVNQAAKSQVMSAYGVSKSEAAFTKAKNMAIKQKLNLHNVFIMHTSQDVMQVVAELNKDPQVEYAEPVYVNKMDQVTPNDEFYSQLVHLPQVKAPEAWEIQYGSSDAIIGVLDSGVDWLHPDLKDVIYRNEAEIDSNGIDDDGNGYVDDVRGWDWVTGLAGDENYNAAPGEDGEEEDNNPMDVDGHGTHVAGISAGHTNNEIGIASVSSGATILPLRCGWLANDGLGYVGSDFAASAYIYAADMGATVVNQSSGSSGQLILDGAYYAFLNGTLITESAGNGDDATPSVLGAQPWVISVAAVDVQDIKSSYSSFGEYVKISAPGNSILSTVPDGQYQNISGTSMAAPLVASVAGLVKAYEPDISVMDLFERVVKSADNIDALNPDNAGLLGTGRVNAYRAMTEEYTALPSFIIRSSRVIEPTLKSAGNNAATNYGNGQLDPGEDVMYELTLRNNWQDAENVSIAISTEDAWPLQLQEEAVAIGSVGGIQDTNSWDAIAAFNISCAANAFPQSVKLIVTVTADGFVQEIEHYISVSPKVLLVSDFDAANGEFLDFTIDFTSSLMKNNISFNQVHHSLTTIDAELLSNYNIVVWGCEWSFTSLEASDRAALADFMDNGGSVFISGQDVGWDLADPAGSENVASAGASLAFYNDYLKSDYVADDAGFSYIKGVDNNEITDGLAVDFFQRRRAVAEQYPDIIEPLDGAEIILRYENGDGGAISYKGDYRVVNFSFGGFEAVTDSSNRDILMGRIIDFLDGIDIEHQPVKDRESSTGSYDVNLNVALDSGEVDSVFIYWDTDGALPFNKLTASSLGDNDYSTEIPAQEIGTDIEYFIYIKSSEGRYSVTERYQFNIGPDNEKPQIGLLNEPYWTSVNAYGAYPYIFNVHMDDNLGVDTSTAQIHYWVGEEEAEVNEMFNLQGNEFGGSFELSEAVPFGTTISFYFSVSDLSVAQNSTLSDTFSYVIDSVQVIDDFENENERWDYGDGWKISTAFANNGSGSITDSPFGHYENDANNPLTFKVPFNLSNYQFAEFSYYVKTALEANKDSVIAEASNDGGESWAFLSSYQRSAFSWRHLVTDMSDFTGAGNDEVWLRFRLSSDSANAFDGVYIDDVMIRVSTDPVTSIKDHVTEIPLNFALKQNFPNPFNPSTTIEYHIAENARVTLKVFNVLGQQVKELISDGAHAPGKYRFDWNAGRDLASGVYIYQLKAVTNKGVLKTFTKKLILLK